MAKLLLAVVVKNAPIGANRPRSADHFVGDTKQYRRKTTHDRGVNQREVQTLEGEGLLDDVRQGGVATHLRQHLIRSVLEKSDQFDPDVGDFGALACAVIRNAGISLIRSKSAARRDLAREELITPPSNHLNNGRSAWDDVAARSDAPPDLLRDLEVAVERLPEAGRDLVVSLYRHDGNVAATARALGLDRSSVRRELSEIRERFAAYKAACEGEG